MTTKNSTRLTEQGIYKLGYSPQGQVHVPDHLVPSLSLRIGKKTKTWRMVLRVNGRLTTLTLGRWPQTSLAAARQLARESLQARDEGRNPRGAQAPTGPVELSPPEPVKRPVSPPEPQQPEWTAGLSLLKGLKDISHVLDIPSGIYFLCSGDRLLYIGQSLAPLGRVADHKRRGRLFDRVFFLPVPQDRLKRVERELIHWLEPPMNGNSPAWEATSRRAAALPSLLPVGESVPGAGGNLKSHSNTMFVDGGLRPVAAPDPKPAAKPRIP